MKILNSRTGRSYSQTVSFSGKNVSLQAVFASIEKQTGLSFSFNVALIKDNISVTLDIEDLPIKVALQEVLKEQDLDFYMKGKTIFIIQKKVVGGKKKISVKETGKQKIKKQDNNSQPKRDEVLSITLFGQKISSSNPGTNTIIILVILALFIIVMIVILKFSIFPIIAAAKGKSIFSKISTKIISWISSKK